MTDPTVDAALALAKMLNLQGPVTRDGVVKYLERTRPELEPAAVLAHAVRSGWLILTREGERVEPGLAWAGQS